MEAASTDEIQLSLTTVTQLLDEIDRMTHRLPLGWKEHISRSSKRSYFVFAAAHLTTWERPNEGTVMQMQWSQLAEGNQKGPASASPELMKALRLLLCMHMDMSKSACSVDPFRVLQLQLAGVFSCVQQARSLDATDVVAADFIDNFSERATQKVSQIQYSDIPHLASLGGMSTQFECVVSVLGCNAMWGSNTSATQFCRHLKRVLAPHGKIILIHLDDNACQETFANTSAKSKGVVGLPPDSSPWFWWNTKQPKSHFGTDIMLRLDGAANTARPPVRLFRCSFPSLSFVSQQSGLFVHSTWRLHSFISCARKFRVPSGGVSSVTSRKDRQQVWKALSHFDNSVLQHLSVSVMVHAPPGLSAT